MADTVNSTSSKTTDEGGSSSSGKAKSETPYPYFSLSHAIRMLGAVRKIGGTEAPSADVMREMGIEKDTDRLWSYGVPSAVQFGLIERVGRGDSGRLKATELGLRVTHPGTPEEERAAKVAAFRTPPLYVKLLERYANADVPPKGGLKNILFRDYGIVESMTTMAADAFIDSLSVAGLVNANNKVILDGAGAGGQGDTATPQPSVASDTPAPPKGTKAVYVPDDYVIYKAKITGGTVLDLPMPPRLKKTDVDKLYAFLQTQIDDEGEERA
jgi:hypothetical protein